MAIKTHNGSAFLDISDVKVYDGIMFKSVNAVNVYNGDSWERVFPEKAAVETVKTWAVSDIRTYGGSGNIWTDYKTSPIQGSYEGTLLTTRRSLLFFPYSDIQNALSGTTIEKVELYLKRLNTSHGQSTAYATVKTHNYASAPTTWNGTDLGDADSGSPSFTRGQSKWITLLSDVGEKLRDGSIKGLCLDADSNYSLSRYIKYDKNIRLRITYSKKGGV